MFSADVKRYACVEVLYRPEVHAFVLRSALPDIGGAVLTACCDRSISI